MIVEVKSTTSVKQNGTGLGTSGGEGKTACAGETTYRRTEANKIQELTFSFVLGVCVFFVFCCFLPALAVRFIIKKKKLDWEAFSASLLSRVF